MTITQFMVALMALVVGSAAIVAQGGAPAAPVNLTTDVSGATVRLAWQAGVGAVPSGFRIEASLLPGGSPIATFAEAAPTLTVTQVPDGTYFVRVRAFNAAGTSPPSAEAVVTVGPPPCGVPNAPSLLTHSVAGNTVSLSWTAPEGGCPVTAYVVFAGLFPGDTRLSVNVGLQTTLQGVVEPATWFVRVFAVNASGYSGMSNEEVVHVVDPCRRPGNPNLLVASVRGTTASFQWEPPSIGAPPTGYILEVGSTFTSSDVAVIGVTHLSFAGRGAPGTYYVRVRATNACGAGVPTITQAITLVDEGG